MPSDDNQSVGALHERLQDALETRDEQSSFHYCIDCDAVYTTLGGEWDCMEADHTLLHESHDSPILSSWERCISYLRTEGHVDE